MMLRNKDKEQFADFLVNRFNPEKVRDMLRSKYSVLPSGYFETIGNFTALVIGNGNVIFLDEPALHLHPTKIKYFGKKLMGMSEKQVIVITHSPYFVELSLFSNGRNLVSVRKIGLVTSRQRHKV